MRRGELRWVAAVRVVGGEETEEESRLGESSDDGEETEEESRLGESSDDGDSRRERRRRLRHEKGKSRYNLEFGP
jgi:hypothetical protein